MSATTLPAEIGQGTTLAYQLLVKGAPTGPVVTLGTVESLDGPSITWGEVETLRLATVFKGYTPTTAEGEATLTVQHVPGDPGIQALRAMLNGPARPPVVQWIVSYTDGYVDTFPGFGKGYQIQSIENESVITAQISIRMTDFVTTTAPANPGP